MISVEAAVERILSAISPLEVEDVPVGEVNRRVLAGDVSSPIDLPLFDNSAMDGYAVRASDLHLASEEHPIRLRLAGRVAAGEQFSGVLNQGECIRLFTGSPLPAGADAVVMQEDVQAEGATAQFVERVTPFENVRLKGEDLKAGTIVGHAGNPVNAAQAGVFAAVGRSRVRVHRKARVGLLATGSELREPGEPLKPGQIYESNRTMLAPLLEGIGCEVQRLPSQIDDLEGTASALRNAFEKVDAVITTGGVSVGEFDFVKTAFTQIGGSIDLWRVAVRPGKPFLFGKMNQRFLFGLPGNPVSALVTFLLLVRPALLKLQGRTRHGLPGVQGRLEESVHNKGDRRHFMRVRWEKGAVRICGPQASHMIASLADANGLIDVAPGQRLDKGDEVTVQLWEFPS